jgi:zinc-ribbon domain
VDSCAHCGARIDPNARYCPHCGRRHNASTDTKVMEVPADETGPVPVTMAQTEPRLYGVTPASGLLALAVAALAVAVVLVVVGRWPFGLLAAGVAVLLVVAFLGAARRTSPGSTSRSTADALDNFRSRATVAAESVATRGRAARRLVALRRELRGMATLRSRLLFELGDAVYRGDANAAEATRTRIDELDRLAAETEGEMQRIVEATHRKVERGRLEVQPTEVAEAPAGPDTPQAPLPGEGHPPEPARIPEPYPPPDESSPPQPAVIPEPGPAVIPEPGPQGAGREAP